MLARFSPTDNPEIANRTAKTCLLRPGAVSDLGLVRQLAERAVTGTEQHSLYRWFLLTQAMADYRAGEFLNAIARLQKTLSLAHDPRYHGSKSTLAGTAYSFLAMAYHQLGHASEARGALDQATQVIDRMVGTKMVGGTGWTDWANGLTFRLLYREAEELVRSKAETRK
jgi:Flp pilus assembly protein TadD